MHGRRPSVIQMAQLWIAAFQFEFPLVLESEYYTSAFDGHDLRGPAVDQPQALVVADPADAVAGAQFDVFRTVDFALSVSTGYQPEKWTP